MEKTFNEIEVRSDAAQEIIGDVPGWLSRWGITLILVLFLLLLLLSWFIKYPDIIRARVIITTSPAPLPLTNRLSGTITLLIGEANSVQKDDIIGYINSNATLNDVLLLEDKLNRGVYDFKTIDDLILGELQPSYTNYLNARNEFKTFRQLDTYSKQINQYTQQKQSYLKLNATLIKQSHISKEELHLASLKFVRDSLLFQQQVISAQDYNSAQTLYLQQKRSHQSSESSIINNEIQIGQILKQISDLEAQRTEKYSALALASENTRSELLASIAKWKETYIFASPGEGTLAYLTFIENNMFVEQGEQLFSVIPESKQIYAQALIPISGSGKVQPGQKVNIQLENYPYQEFGMISGEITEISDLPTNKNYLAKIALPKKLLTTYKKELRFKQQLQGETEIITEDLRVLERMFYQIRVLAKY